jgi:hypothetical protein
MASGASWADAPPKEEILACAKVLTLHGKPVAADSHLLYFVRRYRLTTTTSPVQALRTKMKNPLEKLQGAIGLGIVLTILMVVVINLVHASH